VLVKKVVAGFTLIELMVVLAIMGVLFFVALPAYQNSVIKSNRAAGKGVLLKVMSRQEQYFINNKGYSSTMGGIGLSTIYYVNNQADKVGAGDAVYKIELDLGTTFNGALAIPQNRQTKDSRCMTFAITRTGTKSMTGSATDPQECW
jgi:type IV pilus assembly protein PilE